MRVQKELLFLLHVCSKQSPTQIQAVYKSLSFFLTRWSPDDQRDIKIKLTLTIACSSFGGRWLSQRTLAFPETAEPKPSPNEEEEEEEEDEQEEEILPSTQQPDHQNCQAKKPRKFLQIVKDVGNPK